MKIETRPSFMGVPSGLPETRRLILSETELACLARADALVDKARIMIRDIEGSVDLPYLRLDDFLGKPLEWAAGALPWD